MQRPEHRPHCQECHIFAILHVVFFLADNHLYVCPFLCPCSSHSLSLGHLHLRPLCDWPLPFSFLLRCLNVRGLVFPPAISPCTRPALLSPEMSPCKRPALSLRVQVQFLSVALMVHHCVSSGEISPCTWPALSVYPFHIRSTKSQCTNKET